MTLKEVKEILNAEVISGDHDLGKEIKCAFAAELLSDVLALAQEGALLITGFTNSQVVYAADLANLCAIVLTRGKRPSDETKRLADQKKMPVLTTSFMMFEACGLLYEYGLKTCAIKAENGKKGK
jgi:predicted transcriptional regulator